MGLGRMRFWSAPDPPTSREERLPSLLRVVCAAVSTRVPLQSPAYCPQDVVRVGYDGSASIAALVSACTRLQLVEAWSAASIRDSRIRAVYKEAAGAVGSLRGDCICNHARSVLSDGLWISTATRSARLGLSAKLDSLLVKHIPR